MRYDVEFRHPNGRQEIKRYSDCKDAGMAFAKCQKEFPECTMVHATAFSGTGNMFAKIEHEYPSSVQRQPVEEPKAARPLKPTEALESVMPFYDKVVRQ